MCNNTSKQDGGLVAGGSDEYLQSRKGGIDNKETFRYNCFFYCFRVSQITNLKQIFTKVHRYYFS